MSVMPSARQCFSNLRARTDNTASGHHASQPARSTYCSIAPHFGPCTDKVRADTCAFRTGCAGVGLRWPCFRSLFTSAPLGGRVSYLSAVPQRLETFEILKEHE